MLSDFLDDDGGGAVRVQKAQPEDQAHGGVGAAKGGLGARLARSQGGHAALLVGGQQLVVALAREAVLGGHLDDGLSQALALDEHEEALGQRVVRIHGQGLAGSENPMSRKIETQSVVHGRRIKERRENVT